MQTTPPYLKSRQSLLLGSLKFDNVQYRPASVNKGHSSALGLKLPQGLLPNLPTSPSKHHTLQTTTTLTTSKAPSNSRRWVSYIAKSSPAQGRCRRALPSRSRQTSAGVALVEIRLVAACRSSLPSKRGHTRGRAAIRSYSESPRLRMAMNRATIRGS